jgi:putative iron-only hydrogenase system regulator
MEKRVGTALILVSNSDSIGRLNEVIFQHASIVIGRQGIPFRDQAINIISLVLLGSTDEMGSLTGQLGRIDGVQVKSALLKGNFNNTLN